MDGVAVIQGADAVHVAVLTFRSVPLARHLPADPLAVRWTVGELRRRHDQVDVVRVKV